MQPPSGGSNRYFIHVYVTSWDYGFVVDGKYNLENAEIINTSRYNPISLLMKNVKFYINKRLY